MSASQEADITVFCFKLFDYRVASLSWKVVARRTSPVW